MKKFVKYLLVLCLMVPFAFMFAGCGESAPSNVMTMSVNPEISFVLDANNNVASVKFENADASMIYADINFVGKDVDTTVQLFIERAAISGHINLKGDEVSVEINGEVNANLDALKNQVKAKVESVFSDLGVTVTVKMENLTKEAQRTALETTAKALAPEKTSTEIKEMSNADLLKLINDKQKEYEDLAYSQVTEIKATLEKTVMSAVNTAKDLLEAAEKKLAESEERLENSPSLKQEIQPLIDTAKSNVAQCKTDLNNQIKILNDKKDELISKAKEKYTEIKNELISTYKDQVADAKTTVLAHLQTELNLGHITQDQYNYWKNLIDNNVKAQ